MDDVACRLAMRTDWCSCGGNMAVMPDRPAELLINSNVDGDGSDGRGI